MKDTLKDALNEIDDTYIAEAAEPYRRNSMVGLVAALAAMLVLLISVAFALGKDPGGPVQMGSQPGTSGFYPSSGTSSIPHSDPSSVPTTPPTLPDSFTVPLVDFTREPDKLTGFHPSEYEKSDESCASPSSDLHFAIKMVVEARVIKVLPDKFLHPEYGYCHVLIMETLDALNVDGMPKQFNFMLPYWIDPHWEQFDSLIISLEQYGIENFLLINTTTHTYEQFDKIFVPTSDLSPTENVIAFTDGLLDASLWIDNPWTEEFLEDFFDTVDKGEQYYFFPAGRNSTLEECKEVIRQEISKNENLQYQKIYSRADYGNEDIFAYIDSSANGSFYHRFAGTLVYGRRINGISTNEMLNIYTNGDVYSLLISQEDLSCLPDLGTLVDTLHKTLGIIPSPNAAIYLEQGYELVKARAGAQYFITYHSKEVYGLLVVNWEYSKPGTRDKKDDTLYYVISMDGSCRAISWEEFEYLRFHYCY